MYSINIDGSLPWILFEDEQSERLEEVARLLFSVPKDDSYPSNVPLLPFSFYHQCYRDGKCREQMIQNLDSDRVLPVVMMLIYILEGNEPALRDCSQLILDLQSSRYYAYTGFMRE